MRPSSFQAIRWLFDLLGRKFHQAFERRTGIQMKDVSIWGTIGLCLLVVVALTMSVSDPTIDLTSVLELIMGQR